MSFDLFGPATKCDIRVGYISTDRGFVDRVGVHDANQYAKRKNKKITRRIGQVD